MDYDSSLPKRVVSCAKERTANVTWVAPLIVIGVVGTALATTVFIFRRKKIQLYKRIRKTNPRLSWREFSRRLTLGVAGRIMEEESQRTDAIRKALATRDKS